MKKLLTLYFLSTSMLLFGQNNNAQKAGSAMRNTIEGTYLGSGNPISDDVELIPELIHISSKNESSNEKELDAIKEEQMKLKLDYIKVHPEFLSEEQVLNKKTRTNAPSLIVGYNALGNQGTPSDNTVAINKNNQIICVVNSSLRYYNASTGAALQSTISLSNFFSTPSNGNLLSTSTCDPKVIFDPQAEKFIVFAQTCDGSSSTSQILLAFSNTSDPTQGWKFYTFTGNPSGSIGQNVWFDYPKIGVSNSDVFVTGNLFNNNGQYVQSVIYQINKIKCYAGNTIASGDAIIWYNIDNSPFTMVPMSNGQSGGYGNNMFLASNISNQFGTYVALYEISNAVTNNPQISTTLLSNDTTGSPANGIQKGSSVELETGDSRGMDGYYLNGTIHFVFHCNVGAGYSGVNYSRIKKVGSNWTLSKRILKIAGTDISFPSIASMGFNNNDQSAIIGFNYASTNDFPGMKAIYVDNSMDVSAPIEVKTGTGYASVVTSGGITRWGDYTGMTRVQNATTPTAWLFGMFGNTSHGWTNHFAKISTNGWPLATASIEENTNKVEVYPNPVIEDLFNTELELKEGGTVDINIIDVNGTLVKKLYKGYAVKGKNLFSFNKGALATGTYIVSFTLNNKLIKNEKISIIHP